MFVSMNINVIRGLWFPLALAVLVLAVLAGHDLAHSALTADGFGWGDVTAPPVADGFGWGDAAPSTTSARTA